MVENFSETEQRTAVKSADAAWISFPVPFRPEVLQRYCRDIEVLFRANPYYHFETWRQTGPDTFHAEFKNHSNQTSQALKLTITQDSVHDITISYDTGIKKRTLFTIEPAPDGSRMTLTDDYDLLPPVEREQRKSEVDKSLNAWAESLRLYFLRLKRWSWLPGWHWYLRRVWIPMKPSARRIVWFIYLITVAEFFFFLFVLLIYLIELKN